MARETYLELVRAKGGHRKVREAAKMSTASIGVSEELNDYLLSVSLRDDDISRRLREETAAMPRSEMQIAPEQGQFMAMMVELTQAKRIIEIGTFTGYSALSMARALPPDGELVTCDISQEWASVGQRYWEEAGLSDRIRLRVGPAVDTLDQLIESHGTGSFDLAFIDADKENYGAYYEKCLQLVRKGGLIMIDNVLWEGQVIDPLVNDVHTKAIRELNNFVHDDERVTISMIPLADGLTLARKR